MRPPTPTSNGRRDDAERVVRARYARGAGAARRGRAGARRAARARRGRRAAAPDDSNRVVLPAAGLRPDAGPLRRRGRRRGRGARDGRGGRGPGAEAVRGAAAADPEPGDRAAPGRHREPTELLLPHRGAAGAVRAEAGARAHSGLRDRRAVLLQPAHHLRAGRRPAGRRAHLELRDRVREAFHPIQGHQDAARRPGGPRLSRGLAPPALPRRRLALPDGAQRRLFAEFRPVRHPARVPVPPGVREGLPPRAQAHQAAAVPPVPSQALRLRGGDQDVAEALPQALLHHHARDGRVPRRVLSQAHLLVKSHHRPPRPHQQRRPLRLLRQARQEVVRLRRRQGEPDRRGAAVPRPGRQCDRLFGLRPDLRGR